jgi:hypothetical protein
LESQSTDTEKKKSRDRRQKKRFDSDDDSCEPLKWEETPTARAVHATSSSALVSPPPPPPFLDNPLFTPSDLFSLISPPNHSSSHTPPSVPVLNTLGIGSSTLMNSQPPPSVLSTPLSTHYYLPSPNRSPFRTPSVHQLHATPNHNHQLVNVQSREPAASRASKAQLSHSFMTPLHDHQPSHIASAASFSLLQNHSSDNLQQDGLPLRNTPGSRHSQAISQLELHHPTSQDQQPLTQQQGTCVCVFERMYKLL